MALTLEAIHGRIMDLDSHEQIPPALYLEMLGDRAKRFATVGKKTLDMLGNAFKGAVADEGPIDRDTVWEKKNFEAPGAINMDRRTLVMDAMGVQRQMVFPSVALGALSQALGGLYYTPSEEERLAAWEMIDAYNEWAAALTSKYPQRMYVTAIISSCRPGVTVGSLTKEAERLIKLGVRGVFVPSGLPPVGLSPGDEALDPFYATLAEAKVPLVTHPPGGVGFMNSVWGPGVRGGTWVHMSEENFLAAMVAGGVFERHPTLRFGAIECGASWVGPLAEYLDFWLDPKRRPNNSVRIVVGDADTRLKLKPSEYIARNCRVTPHNFEPVELWLQRYPNLQDVYCYSSDYPHEEGQKWSAKTFHQNIAPLGDKYVEKFFCTNATWLMP